MISLSTLFVDELRFDNRFFLLNEHTTTAVLDWIPVGVDIQYKVMLLVARAQKGQDIFRNLRRKPL